MLFDLHFHMIDHYEIVGLMSGTSLDGLDVAYCVFDYEKGKWKYSISAARTYDYDNDWKQRLLNLETADARQLTQMHPEYGKYCGLLVKQFLSETGLKPDYISSQGHTIFHRPDSGYTFQLGSGAALAAAAGIMTICDFRSADVALGGQGAPLVPIGDKLLFGDYEFCLNIGGFANVSFELEGKRIAYDICPANIILNLLASKLGFGYDEDGKIAAKGILVPELLEKLEKLDYYSANPPKSLGKEWLVSNFLPIVDNFRDQPIEDLMHTVAEHIALRIGNSFGPNIKGTVLITGGGAFNKDLIKRIHSYSSNNLAIPDILTVKYKEALIFAFLGTLRLRGENNCLASVTGSSKDHCSGTIHLAG
jgi:anhydro-N-acetylmuramic acid kinase